MALENSIITFTEPRNYGFYTASFSKEALKKVLERFNEDGKMKMGYTHDYLSNDLLNDYGLGNVATIKALKYEEYNKGKDARLVIEEATINDRQVQRLYDNRKLPSLSIVYRVDLDDVEEDEDYNETINDFQLLSVDIVDYGRCKACTVQYPSDNRTVDMSKVNPFLEAKDHGAKTIEFTEKFKIRYVTNDECDDMTQKNNVIDDDKILVDKKEFNDLVDSVTEMKKLLDSGNKPVIIEDEEEDNTSNSFNYDEVLDKVKTDIKAEAEIENYVDDLISDGILVPAQKEVHYQEAKSMGLERYSNMMTGISKQIELDNQLSNPPRNQKKVIEETENNQVEYEDLPPTYDSLGITPINMEE